MRIHRIQIHGAVPVVILRRAILHHRREPHSRYAEVLQVGQMILDSAQIAAVVRARPRAIVRAGRFHGFVVRRIAIGEAVRHDQVDHVVRRKPQELAKRRRARGQRQLK